MPEWAGCHSEQAAVVDGAVAQGTISHCLSGARYVDVAHRARRRAPGIVGLYLRLHGGQFGPKLGAARNVHDRIDVDHLLLRERDWRTRVVHVVVQKFVRQVVIKKSQPGAPLQPGCGPQI